MPGLAVAKRRLGRRMGSRTVLADGGQTMLCSYLSAILLVRLVANATLGWWWADPIAALVIAGLAIRDLSRFVIDDLRPDEEDEFFRILDES